MFDTGPTVIALSPAPASDLVSLADAKAALGIEGTDHDGTVSALIARASAAVEAHIGRPVLSGLFSETLTVASPGRHALILSRWPITAVSALSLDGEDVTESYDWRIADAGALIRRIDHRSVPWPVGEFSVTYWAGHATTPDDIAAAVLVLIRAMWHALERDPALRSASVGELDMSWQTRPGEADISLVAPMLAPWRVPRVA